MIGNKSSCPYCEKTFTDEDDVVYCPDCGTPHHRACWLEHSECANTNKHSEGFVWKSDDPKAPSQETVTDEKKDEPLVCPYCGTESSPNTLVCPGCGTRFGAVPNNSGSFSYNTDFFMRGITQEADADLGGVTVKEAAMYVQNKASDYVKKFSKKKKSGNKIGWNWAAFLFSPLWFFYRKLYKAGLCFVAVSLSLALFVAVPMSKEYDVAIAKIEEYITIDEDMTYAELQTAINDLTEEQTASIMNAMQGYFKWMIILVAVQFIPNIAAAMIADNVYKRKIVEDVASIRDFSQNQKTFEVLMLRKGGTSVIGLLGGYCLFNLLYNILLLF